MRPSCASIIERQIDRPIPIPSDFLVNSGSNIRSMSCEPIPVPVSATDTFTPQLDSISHDRRQLLIRLGPDQYPVLLQVVADQGKGFPDEVVDVERSPAA